MRKLILISLILVFSAPVFAFEIKVFEGNDQVLIRAVAVPLPDLARQLKSGLTTTLVSQLSVEVGGQTSKISRTFLIYFDLWDELYQMKALQDGVVEKFSGKEPAEILRYITTQEFKLPSNHLATGTAHLSFRISLNPISQEKVQKIRKWLAENNVNLPSSARGAGAAEKAPSSEKATTDNNPSLIAGARFSGMLAQVLNSELTEENTGLWSFTSPTETFYLKGRGK